MFGRLTRVGMGAAAAPLLALMAAGIATAAPGDVVPVSATGSPSPAAPGTIVTVTASWQFVGAVVPAAVDVNLTMPQELIDAGATWVDPPTIEPPDASQACFVDADPAVVGCLWRPDADETAVMKARLVLPPSIPSGSYPVIARADTSQDQTATVVVGAAPTSPAPTTTPATPITTTAPTADASAAAELPTAVPAGRASDGAAADFARVGAALVLGATLSVAVLTSRRRASGARHL